MNYIIKIDAKDKKAKSIINMLKELAQDYPFLQIYEDEPELSENQIEELEARYHYVRNNPEEGKSWEEVKSRLLSE
jgi:transcriptional accessory protein Tex/SPT6